jgi:hypothetical protein
MYRSSSAMLPACLRTPISARSIDYRNLVGALKRKPGAFARWVLCDAAFPRAVYRQTWERLAAQKPEREARSRQESMRPLCARNRPVTGK